MDAPTPAEAIAQAEAWIDYYRELGIEQIATGIVVLRRRAGRNWVHSEELVSARPGSGNHLARIFAGHDSLEHIAGDGELLSLSLSLAPQVSLVERRMAGGNLERARLTADTGMQLPARVTPSTAAAALLELNGVRTLAEAGARAGVARGELEAALPSVRALVERGYIICRGGEDLVGG